MTSFLLAHPQSVGTGAFPAFGIVVRSCSLAARESDESAAYNLELPAASSRLAMLAGASALLPRCSGTQFKKPAAPLTPSPRQAGVGGIPALVPAPYSTGATVVTGCAGGPLSAPVVLSSHHEMRA